MCKRKHILLEREILQISSSESWSQNAYKNDQQPNTLSPRVKNKYNYNAVKEQQKIFFPLVSERPSTLKPMSGFNTVQTGKVMHAL